MLANSDILAWYMYLSMTYLLSPLCASVDIRSLPEIATGFGQLLVVSRWPHIQPLSFISLSTVFLYVSFGRPLFLWPSGVHLRAVGVMRSTCPIHFHLFCYTCCVIGSVLVILCTSNNNKNLYLCSCLIHVIYYKTILKIKLEYWLPGITIGTSGARQLVDISIK